jgi:hypothetical protein
MQPSLTVEGALKLLEDAAKSIECRDVTDKEGRRIQDAIKALDEDLASASSRRKKYCAFLSQVLNNSSRQLVILCAIGLGPSRVIGMKEDNRLRLATSIGNRPDLAVLTLETLDERDWTLWQAKRPLFHSGWPNIKESEPPLTYNFITTGQRPPTIDQAQCSQESNRIESNRPIRNRVRIGVPLQRKANGGGWPLMFRVL